MRDLLLPFGVAGWTGAVAAVLSAALRVAVVPLFVGPVVDRVLALGALDELPRVLLASGAAVVGMSLALAVQDAAFARAGAAVAAEGRRRAYHALLNRTPGRLPGTSGGLSGRILSDLREVETFHQYGLGTLIAEGAAVAGVLGVLFWRAPGPTALLVVLGLPAAVLLGVLGRRLRAHATRAQRGTEAVGAHLQEGLRHHAVARAFGADGFLLRRFDEANTATRRAAGRRGLLAALQIPATQIAVFAALAGLVTLLAQRAAAGLMSVGEVIEYLTLVALLSTPAQLLPRGYALLRQAEAAAARLVDLVAHPPRQDPLAAAPAPAEATPVGNAMVHLEDVWAGFEGGAPVLRGATVRLPERGLVAMVGDSGAGKTTLLQVLLGFLTPTRGRITVAGLTPALGRAKVGWVPQSLDLMRGTVRENLTLGRPVGDEVVRRALSAVGMAEVVASLPSGIDHPLSEDGAGLSGGQRQRLLVARALLSDPAVLLLDEPTANLDPGAEAGLVRTLRDEATRRLVLAVAHRQALAEAADVVLKLEEGRLVHVRPAATEAS